MKKPSSIEEITHIFLTQGQQQYGGEDVSQLEHALQCAYLAEQAQADINMIASCLLHDLGHLIGGEKPHEESALPLLETIFKPEITEPIRLHVAAKRYLCAVDDQYWSNLSLASQNSLVIQGGKFSPQMAAKFKQQPYVQGAIQLRLWDEQAKVSGLSTPDWEHFITLIEVLCN
jgi:phosphonate degradation associated HDIG domain protein